MGYVRRKGGVGLCRLLSEATPTSATVAGIRRAFYVGPMGQTAVVVLIAEAEPVVSDHRLRHDWAAARGVPAHVTILYPFRAEVDEHTATTVQAICRSLDAFQVTFRSVGRFPGEVVWLRPDPSELFSALIDAFVAAVPEHPPYGGQVLSPVPHLTVADGVDTSVADELERQLISGLPVSSVVERLTLLIEGANGRWSVDRSWPLQRARPSCAP